MNVLPRSVSSYDISIATGLAFESLFEPTHIRYDNQREVPNYIDLSGYDSFYVSVNTLARNIVKSYKSEDFIQLDKEDLLTLLEHEIEVIKDLLFNNSASTELVFFLCEYKFFDARIKNPLMRKRTANTNKQLLEQTLIEGLCQLAGKKLDFIKVFNRLKPVSKKVLIFTSNTIDLCDHEKFNQLSLLESTTGVLKNKELFYTRYFNGKTIYPLPFNFRLLVIYGDNHMFKPTDLKVRNEITELAVKMKWTPLTTTAKINHDVGTFLMDKALAEIFLLI